ncbi:inositol hexakisphosphate kinase 1 [Cladorrhinum sp. PSN332]|nr:inositol hexakisphosphate kinase 1 [Cladorrhinum sp. PSN332]
MSNPPYSSENAAPALPSSSSSSSSLEPPSSCASATASPPPAKVVNIKEERQEEKEKEEEEGPLAAPVPPSSGPVTTTHAPQQPPPPQPAADQIKYGRGPAVLQRPLGPSLLTQALATARGIPPQLESHNGPSHHPESEEITPRPSPRNPAAMSSSTTITATAIAPPAYGRLDLGEVNSMLNGHREYLAKNKDSGGGHALYTESPIPIQHDTSVDENAALDSRPPARPWKSEHRVSMGPEKAWSIGSGDVENGENGQVEKSITEVLAGVEPNARSRKASHSLRFFKEGLPEEKGKRKDGRSATFPREKPQGAGEIGADTETLGEGEEANNEIRAPDDKPCVAEQPARARTIPVRTPGAETIRESPEDYFLLERSELAIRSPVKPSGASRKPEDQGQRALQTEKPAPKFDLRQESEASVGTGDSAVEDGEESGEEKISSAVFLPHQVPEQAEEPAPVSGAPTRSAPSRTLSRHDDGHPWLVKADEPEAEQNEESDVEKKLRSEPAAGSNVAPKLALTQPDQPTVAVESAVPPSRPSRPVSQYNEENVHDHQWEPKQPLEAIELIPYKHQVGGHTTLWRFSKRAVCKQLNNRENEFYEKIERYHRDLLAFLPRYIGVLNVTFQKQPRRKSTMRKDDSALEHVQTEANTNGTAADEAAQNYIKPEQTRIISQSIQNNQGQIPTVTFVDNQHILPRNLLQPTSPILGNRFRSASAAPQRTGWDKPDAPITAAQHAIRPSLQERHAHSWGATTVNKKLRNEVFNDAFLKQPIAIHRHRKGHQRPLPRRTLQSSLRPAGSDTTLTESCEKCNTHAKPIKVNGNHLGQSQSDLGHHVGYADGEDDAPKDVTGTSAPEPEILGGSSPATLKKKRRYSGSGLRRKPDDVREERGNLKYFEEADDISHKGPREDIVAETLRKPAARTDQQSELPKLITNGSGDGHQDTAADISALTSAANSGLPSPTAEFKKIARPINPKEAQTQRDSRVEYFLLLEDLTAGMKRPCIMDLKMGTRQYGVDANTMKQKSQQGKCAKTTSRELGVRVCGLQVWDAKTQSYVFKDKYYGRELKKGHEFQAALTRFLYDGVDPSSILRHIPTVLRKLGELEVIVKRLHGYRFYAASLLMFYDGDDTPPESEQQQNQHYIEDSTTDFCTDTEEAPRRLKSKKKSEIDFKIADFANCITPMDSMEDKACPPRHPDQADNGFVRGLGSLRKYFLRIQRDTREEMGLISRGFQEEMDEDDDEDEGSVSE